MTEASSPPSAFLQLRKNDCFWVLLLLVAAMMIGYIWNVKPTLSPNDNARWDTVWSLVEDGTYEIDDIDRQFPTIDKVVRAHDGKVVSSKPPLLPTVIAGYVKLWQFVLQKPFTKDTPVPGKPTIPGSIHIYAKLVLIAFNGIPFLLMLWLYKRFLDRTARTDFAWIYSLLTMAFGTLVTGYIVTLNNHVIAATWGFIAVYNLIRIWYDDQQQWWRYALAGLLVGWTAANELPAGLLALVATGILLYKNWSKTILCFIPPLALVTAAFFYTNFLAIGDPSDIWKRPNFEPAYLQKELYQTDIDGKESYWKEGNPNRSAIDALNDNPEPQWLYILHCTIGHHGLFSLSPILLLCLWGWICHTSRRGPFNPSPTQDSSDRMPGFAVVLAFITLVVFSFYLFITDQRNYGGFCHGLRWMIWLTPMWLFLLPAALDRIPNRRWIHILAWIVLAVSVLSVFDTWYNPWTRAWLHRIMLYADIINY